MAEATTANKPSIGDTLNPFKGESRKPRGPKPKTAGRKKDLSTGIGMLWGMGGGALAMRGELAGRVMQVQAPVAGRELNRWVKEHDTIYAIVSPLLGAEEITVLSKVFAPPLLIGLMQHRPEMVPMFRPLVLPMMLELFTELKKYQAKEQETLAMLSDALDSKEAEEEFEAFLEGLGLAGEQAPPPSPAGMEEVPLHTDDGQAVGPPPPSSEEYQARHTGAE